MSLRGRDCRVRNIANKQDMLIKNNRIHERGIIHKKIKILYIDKKNAVLKF